MGVKGMLESCRRCGRTVFLKYDKTIKLDGGYTEEDMYEPLPDDWHRIYAVGVLCPECVAMFRNAMIDFFGRDNTPSYFLVGESKKENEQ